MFANVLLAQIQKKIKKYIKIFTIHLPIESLLQVCSNVHSKENIHNILRHPKKQIRTTHRPKAKCYIKWPPRGCHSKGTRHWFAL